MIVDGTTFWTIHEAVAQLGVDRKRINDWVRRGFVAHPHRVGRNWYYNAQQLLDTELKTRISQIVHGGAPRRNR